jgi:hypothetical protein
MEYSKDFINNYCNILKKNFHSNKIDTDNNLEIKSTSEQLQKQNNADLISNDIDKADRNNLQAKENNQNNIISEVIPQQNGQEK